MSEAQTWVEALNIKPESLAEWSSQAPEGMPLLIYCLKQGHVPFEEYLSWAQQHFEMAYLKPDFFQTAFDPASLEQARLSGTWHPWCFPVNEWEDVTYVACVEPLPPQDGSKICYVLADPRRMSVAWGETSTSNSNLPAQLTNEDLPAGMTAEVKPFTLNLEEATFNIGPVTEVKPMVTEEPPPAQAPPVREGTGLTLVLNVPTARAEEVPPAAPMVPAPSVPELTIPAPKAPFAATVPDLQVVAAEKSAKKAMAAKATVTPAEEDVAIKTLFASLRERYSASLIMKCGDQNARPYKWDQTLTPQVDSDKTTVNLSYPTFMRIVAKTKLPYHGYLVDSPAHREFFAALNLPEIPVCVTAIPICFDDHLWGMVVAFGGEENQKMDSLSFVQDHSERLVNSVAGSWSKAS